MKLIDFSGCKESDIFPFISINGTPYDLEIQNFLSNCVKYMTDDREILYSEKDGITRLYFSTSFEKSDACLLTIEDRFLKLEEANYNRVGNGINQDGIITTRTMSFKNNALKEESYAISLTKVVNRTAKITYFGDLNNLEASFAIDVDPNTLDAYGKNRKITDTLNKNGSLVLFRKSRVKGINFIYGSREVSLEDDILALDTHFNIKK